MISPFNRSFGGILFLFYHLISRSTIYFSLLIENGHATSHNHCMLCWYLHALCHLEDIRFADYICTILNYATDL